MVCHLNAELFLDGFLDVLKPGVAILQHLSCVEVNEMVVLPELVGTFILCAVVPELVLDHQIAVEQQLDGVVQGGAADTVFVVLHLVVERLNVEMAIGGIDLLKDGKAFRSLP